jgi:hypothetical protein
MEDALMDNVYLRKTHEQWSSGTRVHFIEYAEFHDDEPISALVRIQGIQLVIPLEYLVERRERSSTVIVPTREERELRNSRMLDNE